MGEPRTFVLVIEKKTKAEVLRLCVNQDDEGTDIHARLRQAEKRFPDRTLYRIDGLTIHSAREVSHG